MRFIKTHSWGIQIPYVVKEIVPGSLRRFLGIVQMIDIHAKCVSVFFLELEYQRPLSRWTDDKMEDV